MASLGANIKRSRKAAKITQESLAREIGVTKAAISRYESGLREPSLDQLIKIADTLQVSTFDLIGKTATAAYEMGVDNITKLHDHLDNIASDIWRSYGYTGSETESKLIQAFSKLNEEGQRKAVERIQELVEVPRYQATSQEKPFDKEADIQ